MKLYLTLLNWTVLMVLFIESRAFRILLRWVVGFFCLIALSCSAATYTAATAAYADVNAKVALTSTGDTVLIPAGGATWTSVLQITNGIWIIGAGSTKTLITNGIPQNPPWDSGTHTPPLFWVLSPSGAGMRISTMGLYGNGNGRAVYFDTLDLTGNPSLLGFRVDHCFINKGIPRAIDIFGSAWGVVDHCVFIDNFLSFGMISGDSKEWNKTVGPYYFLGSTNNPVLEDNYIGYTSFAIGQGMAPTDCGQGGHYVWRHNVVSNSVAAGIDGLDLHGNMHYFWQDGWRASVCYECYSNTFVNINGNISRSMNLRGGTCMVFSNQFVGTWDNNKVVLQEEECWGTSFPTNIVAWPGQDQITNSFIWGNVLNGVETNMVSISDAAPCVAAFEIFLNRDYWIHPPNNTNVLVNYAPLIYPHPLVQAQDGIPLPMPTNVTAIYK